MSQFPEMDRRDFLRLAAGVPVALGLAPGLRAAPGSGSAGPLQSCDYRGVRLLPSRWLDQFQQSRDYYLGVANDDILHGYRVAAGLPAPGQTLGGWCAKNSDEIFGQWLSGFARIYCATGDAPLREKAVYLLNEWGKTLGPNGDCRMGLYAYDKMLCGLVDLELYAGVGEARPLLEKTMAWAMATFSPERGPATPDRINGHPAEWYTLAENVYRAYALTGKEEYRRFADSYLDHEFWNKFADTAAPEGAYHVHAYSHVNSLSSAAMAFEVTGDPAYLRIIVHAYTYLQDTQCYATGGYGPMERWVPPDGTLGRSLEARNASFETVCGSWAGFKLARYLQRFSGEARYGDWAERLLYNAVGAALPITTDGKHFYYSDYRVGGGMKVYKVSRYACCSGTLVQCVADYHNLIYYRDQAGPYVNLFVPSELTWEGPAGAVRLTQTTRYPEAETTRLRLAMDRPARFKLRVRVPGWAPGLAARINGAPLEVRGGPGTWAEFDREWSPGDQLEIRVPLALRMVPVDVQHLRRVAVVRGPVVLAMDDWVFEEIPQLPDPRQLASWLVPDDQPGVFRIAAQGGKQYQAKFRPFYAFGEVVPYRIYHDLDARPIPVW